MAGNLKFKKFKSIDRMSKVAKNVMQSGRIPSTAAGGDSIALFSPATLNHTHFYDICRRIGGAQDWSIKRKEKIQRVIDYFAAWMPLLCLCLSFICSALEAPSFCVVRAHSNCAKVSFHHSCFISGRPRAEREAEIKLKLTGCDQSIHTSHCFNLCSGWKRKPKESEGLEIIETRPTIFVAHIKASAAIFHVQFSPFLPPLVPIRSFSFRY